MRVRVCVCVCSFTVKPQQPLCVRAVRASPCVFEECVRVRLRLRLQLHGEAQVLHWPYRPLRNLSIRLLDSLHRGVCVCV